MLQAWNGIENHTVGTILIAREDRLFRHRHLDQVDEFTRECQKHNVLVIVAGKRCYDFSRNEDLDAFIQKMRDAYAYLRHIEDMHLMQAQKQQRGEWIGSPLIAPYVIDKAEQARIKEIIRVLKGEGKTNIQYTDDMTHAYRPVIYQPWLDISLDLFAKLKLYNFYAPRLMRYIEEKWYLFPHPTGEDMSKYLFKFHMQQVPGMGYTFNTPQAVERWILNPYHMGWMIVGKEEIGKTKGGRLLYESIYMEDCFEGILSREEFEEYYIELKGKDLNGNPVESRRARQKAHFTRKYPTGSANTLLNGLFTISDYSILTQKNGKHIWYKAKAHAWRPGVRSEHAYTPQVLWLLPANPIDREVVDRLREIAKCDKEMANRVEKYYNELVESRAPEKKLVQNDITMLERRIAHLQMLITTPDLGYTPQQLASFIKDQQDTQRDLAIAQRKMDRQKELQPSEIIPNFYRILGKVPSEFWNLDIDHQRKMLRKLIEEIEIKNIAPHIYTLTLKWIQPVAKRPDVAIIYRGSSVRNIWTTEEETWLRANYPVRDKLEILQHFPDRTWQVIEARAFRLGIQREVPRYPGATLHRDLAYNDWVKLCEYLGTDYKSGEGEQILDRLNYYAAEIGNYSIAPLDWLMSASEIATSAIATEEATDTNSTSVLGEDWGKPSC